MRHASIGILLLALLLPGQGRAETPPLEPLSPGPTPIRNTLLSAAFVGGTLLLNPRVREIPVEGFDPSDIAFALDRNSVSPRNAGDVTTSDRFLYASIAYPALATGILAGSGNGRGAGWLTQIECSCVTSGLTTLLKVAVSRPRPYTHLDAYERADDEVPYWATSQASFESFPSGHSSVAWASTLSGSVYLARTRPDLPPVVHALTGAVGAGLATTTAVYRVKAGMHFPTDVMAGCAIGAGVGLVVPLLQTPGGPGTGRALKWTLLGAAAGTLVSVLVTPPASPF